MAKSFDEILTSMLEQLENNPDLDIEVLVKDECEKMGVSEKGKALLSETNEYIDGFAEKLAVLQKARMKASLASNGCLRRWTEYWRDVTSRRRLKSFLLFLMLVRM